MSMRNRISFVGNPTLFKKALLYRLLSILVTIIVAFVVVGDVAIAANVGIAANVLKFGLYYVYEWAWQSDIQPLQLLQ